MSTFLVGKRFTSTFECFYSNDILYLPLILVLFTKVVVTPSVSVELYNKKVVNDLKNVFNLPLVKKIIQQLPSIYLITKSDSAES